MNWLLEKIKYHAEWLLIPLFIAAVVGAILGVFYVTGSWPKDDLGELVSSALRGVRAVLAVVLASCTQSQLFGWRGESAAATIWDHVLDSVCTLTLLIFFAVLLWH